MKATIFALILLIASAALTVPVQAASQDECAIWLCLPGGFPSGCGAAHAAMVKRVLRGKSPLPAFESCAVKTPDGGGAQMTSLYGVSAYVPGRGYIRGTTCEYDDERGLLIPAGCTGTYQWAEVYIDGRLAGPPFYWQ